MLAVHKTRWRRGQQPEIQNQQHVIYSESPISRPASTEELYRLINKVERDIGGDSGIIGMSGSVSRLDLTRILKVMQIGDSESHFLDVGSGLGRPMLHALLAGAMQVSGVEFDAMKHCKSQTVIARVMPISDQVRSSFYHADVMDLQHISQLGKNITHLYSFWEGINIDAREVVARLVTQEWRRGGKISYVAFVQEHVRHLESYMFELGFPTELRLIDTFPVSMIGSANHFRAYIFKFDLQEPRSMRPDSKTGELSSRAQPKRPKSAIIENQISLGVISSREMTIDDYVVDKRRSRFSCLLVEPPLKYSIFMTGKDDHDDLRKTTDLCSNERHSSEGQEVSLESESLNHVTTGLPNPEYNPAECPAMGSHAIQSPARLDVQGTSNHRDVEAQQFPAEVMETGHSAIAPILSCNVSLLPLARSKEDVVEVDDPVVHEGALTRAATPSLVQKETELLAPHASSCDIVVHERQSCALSEISSLDLPHSRKRKRAGHISRSSPNTPNESPRPLHSNGFDDEVDEIQISPSLVKSIAVLPNEGEGSPTHIRPQSILKAAALQTDGIIGANDLQPGGFAKADSASTTSRVPCKSPAPGHRKLPRFTYGRSKTLAIGLVYSSKVKDPHSVSSSRETCVAETSCDGDMATSPVSLPVATNATPLVQTKTTDSMQATPNVIRTPSVVRKKNNLTKRSGSSTIRQYSSRSHTNSQSLPLEEHYISFMDESPEPEVLQVLAKPRSASRRMDKSSSTATGPEEEPNGFYPNTNHVLHITSDEVQSSISAGGLRFPDLSKYSLSRVSRHKHDEHNLTFRQRPDRGMISYQNMAGGDEMRSNYKMSGTLNEESDSCDLLDLGGPCHYAARGPSCSYTVGQCSSASSTPAELPSVDDRSRSNMARASPSDRFVMRTAKTSVDNNLSLMRDVQVFGHDKFSSKRRDAKIKPKTHRELRDFQIMSRTPQSTTQHKSLVSSSQAAGQDKLVAAGEQDLALSKRPRLPAKQQQPSSKSSTDARVVVTRSTNVTRVRKAAMIRRKSACLKQETSKSEPLSGLKNSDTKSARRPPKAKRDITTKLSPEVCTLCGQTETSCWRHSDEGDTLCQACYCRGYRRRNRDAKDSDHQGSKQSQDAMSIL